MQCRVLFYFDHLQRHTRRGFWFMFCFVFQILLWAPSRFLSETTLAQDAANASFHYFTTFLAELPVDEISKCAVKKVSKALKAVIIMIKANSLAHRRKIIERYRLNSYSQCQLLVLKMTICQNETYQFEKKYNF